MFALRVRLLVVFAVLGVATPLVAQTVRQPPTLRDRLVVGLQVRRPVEFAFIDAVIDTVERGEMPQKLVDGFFFWARGKAAARPGKRGIIYFQPGLETQAKRLGIAIRTTPPPASGP
ncbi:MAG: hypothetical protein AAFV43_05395 [Planctomycetota bacterium]